MNEVYNNVCLVDPSQHDASEVTSVAEEQAMHTRRPYRIRKLKNMTCLRLRFSFSCLVITKECFSLVLNMVYKLHQDFLFFAAYLQQDINNSICQVGNFQSFDGF